MRSSSATGAWPNGSPFDSGSSNVAACRWALRISRLSGSISPCSGSRPRKYSGWLTRYWSSGLLDATYTAAAALRRRPARPTCCQVPDVDPELQRICADHPTHRSITQPMLNLPALQRKVAAAIAANRLRIPQPVREGLLQVAEKNLYLEPGPAKHDRLNAGAEEDL